LFDGFWEALDEAFEFIVEREKEGWFHMVERRWDDTHLWRGGKWGRCGQGVALGN
jgi:hypothetical protein